LSLDLGADLERLGRADREHPLPELFLVVEERADPGLGVLVLRAPEQGVERTDLDADAAVHAQGVVDVEPVEDADRPVTTAGPAGRTLLLVALDVDAPVGALPGAEHADGAVLLLEGDDAPGPGRRVLPLVGVLHGHGRLHHRPERDAETLDQARAGKFSLGHQKTTLKMPVARMLRSDRGMRYFQARACS